jgi:tetratricopeptide (TPR) repeat protein
MDQLRATFIIGPMTGVRAQDAFTNRIGELEAFRRSLETLRAIQNGDDHRPSLDMSSPRRNVLVYYGLGGIGKTALSRHLERHVTDEALNEDAHENGIAARIDLGEAGEIDLETILLGIRASLSRLNRRWSAFDLAFSLYWEKTHPGEALPSYIRNNTLLRRHASSIDLGEQMQNTLGEVLSEIGMAWTPSRVVVRLAALTHERLSQSMMYRKLTRDCPFFKPIVTAENQTETLAYMSSLLGWQLDDVIRIKAATVAVFIDTFEAASGRDTREIEKHIQRLIFLMPTVLFVVTSRNRLDWAELTHTGELDYIGVDRWPLLHHANTFDEPRQHLVGALSGDDCDSYLRNALRNEDGSETLNQELRARIVNGSEGLPLYLDLAVTQYLEMRATGRPIDIKDFGGPLPSIIVRIMRDLDREQRNVLRGVSLLDAFDLDLARAASEGSDATIVRFVNSSMVSSVVGNIWPYTLHAQLRRTIQETDSQLRDAWSQREWGLAARRVSDYLGAACDVARAERQRMKVVACFGQAVRLAQRFNFFPTWTLDAAQFLADVGLWHTLDIRQTMQHGASSSAEPLIEGLRGIVLRRTGSLDESVRHFDIALNASRLDPRARDLLKLHRTHSLRNSGYYSQARLDYEQILTGGGPFADRARLQLADLSLLRGEFRRALSELDDLTVENDILGEALRIRGHVYRFNCNLDAAELVYRRVLDLSQRIESAGLEGKAVTNLAETLCWTRPAEAARLADEAIEYNSGLGNQLEVLKAYVARGIAIGGAEGETALQEAMRLADISKYKSGRVFAQMGRLFLHATETIAPTRIVEIANEIFSTTETLEAYRYVNDIVRWWLITIGLDDRLLPGLSEFRPEWVDLPELAMQRWVSVFDRRMAGIEDE